MSNKLHDRRPVHINLLKISLPISAISSITHRLSGMYIFFLTLPLGLFLLHYSTKSEANFLVIQSLFQTSTIFTTFVAFSFLIFAYHVLTGVRHLLMDIHIGESLKASKVSSMLVFVLWSILVMLVMRAVVL
jgi:succinate dehydrogenase / fumarate reductase, cytochrome b subunit